MADGKNKSKNTSSSFDEIFGWKDGVSGPSGGRSSGSSSGYFSNVFPPASSGMACDSRHSDLYWTLNKHKADGQVGHGQGSKSQGSPTKKHTTHDKEGKSSYNESMESTYFGSSVHYGGRDFYTGSSGTQSSENSKKYNSNECDEYGNSNAATRGEWWQGSLYY